MSMNSPKTLPLILATLLLSCLLGQSPLRAQDEPPTPAGEEAAQEMSIDEWIDSMMEGPTKLIESIIFYSVEIKEGVNVPLVLVWLGFAAVFFTFYFKFVNLRSMGLAFRTIRGRYTADDDPGEITHFQALTAALSGTVGL